MKDKKENKVRIFANDAYPVKTVLAISKSSVSTSAEMLLSRSKHSSF